MEEAECCSITHHPHLQRLHHHRKSSSWSGLEALPPELYHIREEEEGEEGSDGAQTFPRLAVAAAADGRAHDLSLSPLSASEKPVSSRSAIINRIRNGTGLKLDLDAIRDSTERDGSNAGGGGDTELRLRMERLAACDKVCSSVLPYLFLSGRTVAQNLTVLKDSRITHIINCVGFVCPEYFPNEFVYKTLWLQDSPSEDIMCILYDVFDCIENVRKQIGGRVLVHCCQGVSRSAALVIAYLMWRKSKSFEDAFYEVKSTRDVISPNMGFVSQLIHWQKRILSPCDRESPQIYRIAPYSAYDPLNLVPKVLTPGSGLEVLDSRGVFVIRFPNMRFIWKGKHCDTDMAAVASHAAYQLVRYERSQGPSRLVIEGKKLPKAWLEQWGMSEGNARGRRGNQIPAYDSDYAIYKRAKSGLNVSIASKLGVNHAKK